MEQTHDSPTALELYKGHPVQEAAQIILGSLLFSASMNWIIPVSYTHLTLPTNCTV